MIFSKACEYGIRATIFIGLRSLEGDRAGLRDISAEILSPEAYTAKILQLLVRHNLIRSVKGPSGGFDVDRSAMNRIRLQDVVMAIDGGFRENQCVLGMKACSQKNPCPVHDKYKHIKAALKSMLQDTSLLEMCESIREGNTVLKF